MITQTTIERCKKQDNLAYKEIYEKCIPYVYSVACRYIFDDEDRKDVIQEAFAKTFSKISDFDSSRGEFKFWLRKIIVNECLIHLRKQSKLKIFSINDSFDVVDKNEVSLDSLTKEDILNMLKDMPKRYKSVFMAYIIDGFNHTEIGEMLGITKDTSRSQLTRAKKWIRNNISKDTQTNAYGLF